MSSRHLRLLLALLALGFAALPAGEIARAAAQPGGGASRPAGGGTSGADRGALSAPVEAKTTLPDVEDEVMCPVCGVTLDLATEAPQANQEREFIRRLIAQGLTKEEVKDRLVAEFGDEVLAVPGTEGFDLAAWLVPGAAIVIAAIAIALGLRRWRREAATPQAGQSDGAGRVGGARSGRALSAEERERLDEDLARYDL